MRLIEQTACLVSYCCETGIPPATGSDRNDLGRGFSTVESCSQTTRTTRSATLLLRSVVTLPLTRNGCGPFTTGTGAGNETGTALVAPTMTTCSGPVGSPGRADD